MDSSQWIGELKGYVNGMCIVEIDRHISQYEGRATFYQEGIGSEIVMSAHFGPLDIGEPVKSESRVYFHPLGRADSMSEAEKQHLETQTRTVLADKVRFEGKIEGQRMEVSLQTIADNGSVVGKLSGTLSSAPLPSESIVTAESSIRNWSHFREQIITEPLHGWVFRGQSSLFPLRTSFHRTKRKDLNRFATSDILEAFKATLNVIEHRFDLSNRFDNGAFWYLLQHHGFPTPLLDWTRSPFVAAFFAYQYTSPDDKDGSVRIFAFNPEMWNRDQRTQQDLSVVNVLPHLTFFEPFPFANQRAVVQQALCSVSTIDNIESFVRQKEGGSVGKYLRAFNLPKFERRQVLRELRMMGITPASMLPGLDGTCADLKERLFFAG